VLPQRAFHKVPQSNAVGVIRKASREPAIEQEVAVMSAEFKAKFARTALAVVAVIFLAGTCGTGVAAFAGLLPASKGVAVAMTATPFIDIQVRGLWYADLKMF
jgi:hypothetical protein